MGPTLQATSQYTSWICRCLPWFSNLQSIVVVWRDYVQPLERLYSDYIRPAIGIESRIAALEPLSTYQKRYPTVSILVYGMPYTRPSWASETECKAKAGRACERDEPIRLDLCLENLEAERYSAKVDRGAINGYTRHLGRHI